jgi:hypothetical protein
VYTENLLHLLNLLEISGQSGTLSCSPSANTEEASWLAFCFLNEGKVNEAKILQGADGSLFLEGRMALEWLNSQGGMYWQLKEALPDALPMHPLNPIKQDIPLRRTFRGTRLGVQGMPSHLWSREHRTVFLLIDGTRSRTEMLRILSTYPPKNVDLILADLRSAGLIE